MTFLGPDDRQYIVIAAGSHGTGRTVPGKTDQGDALVAFKLP